MTWWDTLQKPPATAVSAPAQGSARAAAWPQRVSGAAAGTSVRAHGAAVGAGAGGAQGSAALYQITSILHMGMLSGLG